MEGAAQAAAVLRDHGVAEANVEHVWETIALRTSPGIVERRGLLAALTFEDVGIDFGRQAEIVRGEDRLVARRGVSPIPRTRPRLITEPAFTAGSTTMSHRRPATTSTAFSPLWSCSVCRLSTTKNPRREA